LQTKDNLYPHAVVFDLWKTLVPLPDDVKQGAFDATARALGEDPIIFAEPWQRTRKRRETEPLRAYLNWLRCDLETTWSEVMIDDAMRTRRQIHGAMFDAPTPDAVEVLKDLRERRLQTAIVSNASSDVREMLDSSPLANAVDHVVLSAEVSIMKPDPRIFQLVATALDVSADRCWYIGDGNDNELDGAAAAGMAPVLFDLGEGHGWPGKRVNRLSGLIRELPTR